MSRSKGVKEHGERAPGGGRPPEKLKYIETDAGNMLSPERAAEMISERVKEPPTGAVFAYPYPPLGDSRGYLVGEYWSAFLGLLCQVSATINATVVDHLAKLEVMGAAWEERKYQAGIDHKRDTDGSLRKNGDSKES